MNLRIDEVAILQELGASDTQIRWIYILVKLGIVLFMAWCLWSWLAFLEDFRERGCPAYCGELRNLSKQHDYYVP